MAKLPTKTQESPSELDEMRQQLEALRTQNATLEGRLTTAENERNQAQLATMSEAERRLVAQQESCQSSINALSNEADALQAQMVSLQREGNFEEAAGVARKMARAEATLFNETARKDWLAQQREQVKSQNEQARIVQPRAGEKYLADGRPLSTFDNQPSIKMWIEDHPQMFSDKKYLNRVMAAHYSAVENDLTPGSRDYIRHLDENVGESIASVATSDSPFSQPQPGGDLDYSVDRAQRGAAGTGSLGGVPPSRRPPGDNGSGGARGFAPLSEDEQETADALYSHIPNLSERYQLYREHQQFMKDRLSTRNH